MPSKGSEYAGAHDIYMPKAGYIDGGTKLCGLGFSAAVPQGHVALILPRSSTGAKFSVELNNTCGVIDADYRGEWMAMLRTKDHSRFTWEAGDRVLQFLVVPVLSVNLVQVDKLDASGRGEGGFGSTGR